MPDKQPMQFPGRRSAGFFKGTGSRRWIGEGARVGRVVLNFPFVRLQQPDGEIVLGVRAWQLGVFLYFWWNFS